MSDFDAIYDELTQLNLFVMLPHEALNKVASVAVKICFEDGQAFMCQGDLDTPVYFILNGGVRVYRSNPDGREQTLSIFGRGEVFNIPTAFFETNSAPANAETRGKTALLAIKASDFRKMASEIPEFALVVMRDLSEKLHYLTNLVHDVSLRTVRGRLARFLLFQAKSADAPVNWTQEQIATQLGTSREVVSRALRSLIHDGFVQTDRHRIIIPDADNLEAQVDT